MTPRLAASVLATGLMRRAESEGGFAAVLAKGDASAGSILVILKEKDGKQRLVERVLQPEGRYAWQVILTEAAENEGEFERFLERRRKVDPDLWLIELHVASAERFAAEMNAID